MWMQLLYGIKYSKTKQSKLKFESFVPVPKDDDEDDMLMVVVAGTL